MAVRYADENIVQYVADTQKGSSGAPVFNSQMQVVALHHAEAEVIFDVDGRKESVWRNEGIHMNQVMNSLQQANIFFQSSG
jgi:V8-like Glu-specific endopeptidase